MGLGGLVAAVVGPLGLVVDPAGAVEVVLLEEGGPGVVVDDVPVEASAPFEGWELAWVWVAVAAPRKCAGCPLVTQACTAAAGREPSDSRVWAR
jgi:hypothetical protein